MEIPPLSTDLDVGFVDVPPARDGAPAPIELLQQEWRVMDSPAMNGGVIHRHASFGYHLFEISQAQIISEVPPDAQQDY
jgi:hypothetical protein